ncbi:MAG: hypothetical protein ACTSYS_05210 [Promethearchaeota archaeon]
MIIHVAHAELSIILEGTEFNVLSWVLDRILACHYNVKGMGMPKKYPECEHCKIDCDDEKIEEVFEDPEFTKGLLDNIMNVNIEEIINDCYLMSEVISGKTNPRDIADFAYCIFVNLSHLIEIPDNDRSYLANEIKENLEIYWKEALKSREIASKGATSKKEERKVKRSNEDEDIPKSIIEDQAKDSDDIDDFFENLDNELAEIETISENIESIINTEHGEEPAQPKIALKPVIQKLTGKKVTSPINNSMLTSRAMKGPSLGSKQNPIKLTKEMLEGSVMNKDLEKMDMGIKILRVKLRERPKLAPRAAPPLSISDNTISVARDASKSFDSSQSNENMENREYISQQLFQALEQVKARNQAIENGAPLLSFGQVEPQSDDLTLNFKNETNDEFRGAIDDSIKKETLDVSLDLATPFDLLGGSKNDDKTEKEKKKKK